MPITARRPSISVPKIRGKDSLYRYVGIIGSCTTFFQSILWAFLCVIAIIYFFCGGRVNVEKKTILTDYATSLSSFYFDRKIGENGTYLSPVIVFILLIFYLGLSINLIVASWLNYREFNNWQSSKTVQKYGKYWLFSALGMSTYEFVVFALFLADFIYISDGEYVGWAAAPATMMTLAMKGYFMWAYNLALEITVLVLYHKKEYQPNK